MKVLDTYIGYDTISKQLVKIYCGIFNSGKPRYFCELSMGVLKEIDYSEFKVLTTSSK